MHLLLQQLGVGVGVQVRVQEPVGGRVSRTTTSTRYEYVYDYRTTINGWIFSFFLRYPLTVTWTESRRGSVWCSVMRAYARRRSYRLSVRTSFWIHGVPKIHLDPFGSSKFPKFGTDPIPKNDLRIARRRISFSFTFYAIGIHNHKTTQHNSSRYTLH